MLADMMPQSTMHDESTRVAPMCGMAALDGTWLGLGLKLVWDGSVGRHLVRVRVRVSVGWQRWTAPARVGHGVGAPWRRIVVEHTRRRAR